MKNNMDKDLPKGWEVKKLGEICDLQNGFAFKSKDYIDYSNTMNFRMSQIRPSGNIDLEKNPKFLPDSYSKKYQNYLLKEGDVVIAMTDLATETKILGVPTIMPKDDKTWLQNQRVGKFYKIDYSRINLEFLKYALSSHQVNKYYKSLGKGGLQINIKKQDILNVEIPLPPLKQQQQIVTILDKTFAAIDTAKNNAEQNLLNAKEIFASYLQDIFNNKGDDWTEQKLNEISENLDNKRIPITKKHRKSGGVPYYGASGIVDYVKDYIFDENLLCISEDGANLLARTYPIAFSISGKTWVNNHAHVLYFENMYTQKFIELYLNSIKLDDFITGMAQPKLNQTQLNKILIPVPPLKQQQKIVKKLNALQSETKKLEVIYQQKIDDLIELKKSTLQKAFNGEL
jgi:type I restriction enzyme S subunit